MNLFLTAPMLKYGSYIFSPLQKEVEGSIHGEGWEVEDMSRKILQFSQQISFYNLPFISRSPIHVYVLSFKFLLNKVPVCTFSTRRTNSKANHKLKKMQLKYECLRQQCSNMPSQLTKASPRDHLVKKHYVLLFTYVCLKQKQKSRAQCYPTHFAYDLVFSSRLRIQIPKSSVTQQCWPVFKVPLGLVRQNVSHLAHKLLYVRLLLI